MDYREFLSNEATIDRNATEGNCCHWCDRPFVAGDAIDMVGGHPMHEGCAAEYYGVDDDPSDEGDEDTFEDDGQPDEYTEWQDYMGGDDWDHGQYDDDGGY